MKLCKNTVLACTLCAVLTLVVSVIIEFLNKADNSAYLLIQNYCVSLCCSSMLVIIPALLQYKSEKIRTLKELDSLLCDISFYIVMGNWNDLSDRKYRMIAQKLQDLFQQLDQCLVAYSPILPGKQHALLNQLEPIIKASIDFTLVESKESYVAAVRDISNTQKGREIIEIAMEIVKNKALIGMLKECLPEFDIQEEVECTESGQNTEHID